VWQRQQQQQQPPLKAFCQYRGDLSRRDPADVATLRANPNVWNVAQVAKILTDLVRVGKDDED